MMTINRISRDSLSNMIKTTYELEPQINPEIGKFSVHCWLSSLAVYILFAAFTSGACESCRGGGTSSVIPGEGCS